MFHCAFKSHGLEQRFGVYHYFHCCDPRTSDVPTPTVTIAHPNLSGHLTFDEQYPVKKASRIISRKTNHPTSFIRVLKTDKGTVDSMLIDGVEMYGRFFTCETDQTPVPPVKIANPPSELAEPLKKKGTHPYLHL
jgi:hypothetical protein